MNKYHYFDFDENNFDKERKRFCEFLKYLERKQINICSLKKFPPCLTNKKLNPARKQEIIVSEKDFLINNNLFFSFKQQFDQIPHGQKKQSKE